MPDETIKSEELSDHPDLHGPLMSVRLRPIQDREGDLLLEFRAGGAGFAATRHLVLTNARQALKVAAHLRRTVLPEFEAKALELLERSVKE